VARILKKFLKLATVAFGAVLMAFALNLFLVPAHIAPGGVSGLSTVIYHKTGIPVGILIFTLNIPIFILGWKNFGWKFTAWSVYGTFVLSASSYFFQWITPVTQDMILSSVFGGGVLGLGLGIVLRTGASTGGSDIVSKVIYKHFPAVSIGQVIMFVDALVITFAGIMFDSWEVVLYSGVSLFTSSYMVDAVVEGLDFAKTAFIISDKTAEISEFILHNMKRGVTALAGTSPYSGSDKTVLMCVIKKMEINRLKLAVKDIDPNAFMILDDVREVLGRGFKEEG